MSVNRYAAFKHHPLPSSSPPPPPLLSMIMQLSFTPSSLRDEVLRLRDGLLSAMDRVDATSIHGFITAYAFICDFFGVAFNEEVSWVR